jgi:hypothetical protein
VYAQTTHTEEKDFCRIFGNSQKRLLLFSTSRTKYITTRLIVSFLAQILHKGGDAYDIMGKIIKAGKLS